MKEVSLISTNEQKLKLSEQVCSDIESFISKFPNKSFAIRILAKESGVNEKTIKRLLSKSNIPTYDTIFSIYSVILETEDESEIISLSPKSISDVLKNRTARKLKKKKQNVDNFIEVFKKDPVLCELFVKAATGGLNESATSFRYGQYGIELISKLVDLKVIRETDKGLYKLSPSAPTLEGELLKFIGLRFSEVHATTTKGQVADENIISFYASCLNEEGYKAWIKADSEAFYKKLEIAKDPKYKGARRYFTFGATDSIE